MIVWGEIIKQCRVISKISCSKEIGNMIFQDKPIDYRKSKYLPITKVYDKMGMVSIKFNDLTSDAYKSYEKYCNDIKVGNPHGELHKWGYDEDSRTLNSLQSSSYPHLCNPHGELHKWGYDEDCRELRVLESGARAVVKYINGLLNEGVVSFQSVEIE